MLAIPAHPPKEDDGTAFADTAVEDDGAMFADATVEDDAAMACWRRACVCASRWEGNSCSASLAGSRTFVEATRVRLVIPVLFESEGWVVFDGIDKILLNTTVNRRLISKFEVTKNDNTHLMMKNDYGQATGGEEIQCEYPSLII